MYTLLLGCYDVIKATEMVDIGYKHITNRLGYC